MSGLAAGTTRPTPAATPTGRAVRTDIQGLRAVAVAVVVIYHLVPAALPGGFVGVDVFFVISGFLITLHLCEHVPRGGRDLLTFWARRVRRLLPASLLVLGSTLVLSRALGPDTQWASTATDVRAATLYWVNWALASDSVDYLASEEAPSPVQHFWSLAVEEQFYLVWPLLLLALALLARRRGWPWHATALAGVGTVVALSFVWSVVLTATDPAAAYFVTPTRVWELAIGGVLAVVVDGRTRRQAPSVLTERGRQVLATVGLGMIALACATYDSATPFPGAAAALPVLGSAAVLAAGATAATAWSTGSLLARPPVQWLGDVSYSVYLWHWPLVVLLAASPGEQLSAPRVVLVLTLTLVLAALTKTYVEDPFRRPRSTRPVAAAFAAGAAGMAVVLLLSLVQTWEVRRSEGQAREELLAAVAAGGPCFGAAALDDPSACDPVPLDRAVPPPAQAATDRSAAYEQQADGIDCFANPPRFPLRRCEYGSDDDAARTVVLLGNSHAGQWLPTLERLAEEHDLRIVSFVASQCAAVDAPQSFPQSGAGEACARWVSDAVSATVAEQPDAVVYTNRVSVPIADSTLEETYDLHVPAIGSVLETFRDAEVPVLVLRDTPAPDDLIPDCLASTDEAADCDGDRETWLPPEPAEQAVAELSDASLTRYADLIDHICDGETCRAVTGGVVTYFDGSHLTATYAATLAPYLWPSLEATLGEETPDE